jgi:phosphotransferase system enzyme I (PtsP)
VPDKEINNPDAEASRFRQAVAAELAELQRLSERMRLLLSAGDRALFDAYAMLLGSDSLVNGTLERIYAGNWAPGALRATVLEYANIFTEMDDSYLQGTRRRYSRSRPAAVEPLAGRTGGPAASIPTTPS